MTTPREELTVRLENAEMKMEKAMCRARLVATLGLTALVGAVLMTARPVAWAQSPGVTLASLLTRVQAVETKTASLSVSGTDLTITGVNVHIVDGNSYHLTDDGTGGEVSGATLTGLGNLIIGYNASRGGVSDARGGSHNLVLGDRNNYSSYSGLVDGYQNTVSGVYAAVTGGRESEASGRFASVTGGYQNTASGDRASVTGGNNKTASAQYEIEPLGALQTTVSSLQTSVNGLQTSVTNLQIGVSGLQTTTQQQGQITGLFSLQNGVGANTELFLTGVNLHVVNGLGYTNGLANDPYNSLSFTANGLGNLIIGYNERRANAPSIGTDTRTGSHNLVIGIEQNYTGVGGLIAGQYNTTNGLYSSVSGGTSNTANIRWTSISGGQHNTATSSGASVSGGTANTASGPYSSVSGGLSNTASAFEASVSGGDTNTASANTSSISGGVVLTQSNATGWSAGNYHTP